MGLLSVPTSLAHSHRAAISLARPFQAVASRIRRPGRVPTLLLLVCGALLVVVGATATAQAALTSAHFSNGLLNSIVGNDAATVRTFANASLTPEDLRPGSFTDERADFLAAQLAALVSRGDIIRAELRRLDGTVLASSEPGLRGLRAPTTDAFASAVAGKTSAAIVAAPDDLDAAGARPTVPTTLREFFPIVANGTVHGVIALWRDAGPVLGQLDTARRDVVLLTFSAALVAGLLLFLIFRAAQARLTRQAKQLVEATRRDALTGMLNHGSLVSMLADEIEKARRSDGRISVALVDVDNFRLLDDTHGHALGDRVLLQVARLLEEEVPDDAEVGRYGPDEFLIIAPSMTAAALERVIGRVRAALAGVSLRVDQPERVPITVSAGLCVYPHHAQSVTALLSVAALTLKEAKVGGGDAMRVAGVAPEDPTAAASFDVLSGLVLAVDTKDHYTRRHSDDVARYAVFIAEEMNLAPAFARTIDIAGQLHDVGKIGIPDTLLRKPGRLSGEEQRIMAQHASLGDMIVRDLPNIDLVRAGIRHHHERWDGRGYPDRLSGEQIPLIARILAVADAFSAMTTARPYRTAYSVNRALARLEDAAGSQLDADVVRVFALGLRTVPGAPMPRRVPLQAVPRWMPGREVA